MVRTLQNGGANCCRNCQEYEGKAVVGKIDVDSNPGVATQFGIRNIPTILFFKNGEVADKQVGAVPKSVLTSKIEKLL
jgi:thioredoxin 1